MAPSNAASRITLTHPKDSPYQLTPTLPGQAHPTPYVIHAEAGTTITDLSLILMNDRNEPVNLINEYFAKAKYSWVGSRRKDVRDPEHLVRVSILLRPVIIK